MDNEKWIIIDKLAKLEHERRISVKAQSTALLLHYELKILKKETTKIGGFWWRLKQWYGDEVSFRAQEQLLQKRVNKVNKDINKLLNYLSTINDNQFKTNVVTPISENWCEIRNQLENQYCAILNDGAKKY